MRLVDRRVYIASGGSIAEGARRDGAVGGQDSLGVRMNLAKDWLRR